MGRLISAVLVVLLGCQAARAAVTAGPGGDAEVVRDYNRLREQLDHRAWFGRVADTTLRPEALVLAADRDPLDIVLRRTAALLADLKPTAAAGRLAAPAAALQALAQQAAAVSPTDENARKEIYYALCAVRRQIALANPLLNFDALVFTKQYPSRGRHCCDNRFGFLAPPGGGLYVLQQPFGAAPRGVNVLEKAVVESGRLAGQKLDTGAFLAPGLSWDGQTICFAYCECRPDAPVPEDSQIERHWNKGSCFHIFQVNVDGTHLRQLTDGPWNDFDPCFLPNGRIMFISERRGGFGRCHGRPVPTYTLHSMAADGSDILCISHHETNEWAPAVLHDGMVVYTRWDYVDRGDCIAHHPWTVTPDGCDPRSIQGNYPVSRYARPDTEMMIKPIPGSQRLAGTAGPHHGLPIGSLILIDPSQVDDGAMRSVKRITPDVAFPETEGGRASGQYAYPRPLSETYYLCSYGASADSLGLYLVDAFGNRELLYRDAAISSVYPIPLRAEPRPPVLPSRTNPAEQTATVLVANVYDSQKPWPAGTVIKALRVVQLFPKTTFWADRPKIGLAPEALTRGVLGTVPVEADGSAYFTMPAGKLVYFQALDAQGRAVQSMMSATNFQPGEQHSCMGCHEAHASSVVSSGERQALQRAPSALQRDVAGSYPVFYPQLVQPVLDRNCVECHENSHGKVPHLTSRPHGQWTESYSVLAPMGFNMGSKPVDRQPTSNVPGMVGARASRLMALLDKGHHGVVLSSEDRHRLELWIDCNSLFYGAYERADEQVQGIAVPHLRE